MRNTCGQKLVRQQPAVADPRLERAVPASGLGATKAMALMQLFPSQRGAAQGLTENGKPRYRLTLYTPPVAAEPAPIDYWARLNAYQPRALTKAQARKLEWIVLAEATASAAGCRLLPLREALEPAVNVLGAIDLVCPIDLDSRRQSLLHEGLHPLFPLSVLLDGFQDQAVSRTSGYFRKHRHPCFELRGELDPGDV